MNSSALVIEEASPAHPDMLHVEVNMKKIILLAAISTAVLNVAAADHAVKGYVKKDGTYVAPTVATNPNSSKVDNYSAKGNSNPVSGKDGTVDPYKVEPSKAKK